MSTELKTTETIDYFVNKVRNYAERIDSGEHDDKTVAEFSNLVWDENQQSKAAIFGITMLLLRSGMIDPDADSRYADEITNITLSAIERFKARKEAKPE
jgi:hypothetical protein